MNVCSAAPFLHRMFTQRALTCLPLYAHTFARSHLVHDNPKAVDGVIAASAPIWSFTGLDPVYDPNTFDQIVTTDATIGTCASQLKSAWPKILGGCSSCFFLPPLPLLLLLFCAIFCVRNILPRTSLHAYSGTFATGVLTCPPPCPPALHCQDTARRTAGESSCNSNSEPARRFEQRVFTTAPSTTTPWTLCSGLLGFGARLRWAITRTHRPTCSTASRCCRRGL